MTIETKYNIGDEVWFMFDGKPLNGKIARISEYTIKVKVIFKDGKEYLFSRDIKDSKLYPTKEELLKSLPSNKHLGNSYDYWLAPQNNSKQIVVQPLQWLPISRDENGYATEECLNRIFNNLPCAVCSQTEEGYKYYNMVGEYFDMTHNREDIRTNTGYTHYLPIPKLEV